MLKEKKYYLNLIYNLLNFINHSRDIQSMNIANSKQIIGKKRSLMFFINRKIKRILYTFLTRKSLNLFLRGGDEISYQPLIDGVHEAHLNYVFKNFVDNGYSDFLIDIGANIGLTSCQNGNFFKRVFCFEPNPLCSDILKVNLSISLPKELFKIYQFGLGDNEGNFKIFIPKKNWGGAFIRSIDNCYSDEVLAYKDGFSQIDSENYFVDSVKVKSTSKSLGKIFQELQENNLNKGIIKIDVEGFELKIIKGLSSCLPENFELILIFENWNENFDFSTIKNLFPNKKIQISKIEKRIHNIQNSKLLKLIYLLLGRSEATYLLPQEKSLTKIGDHVVEIKK